MPTPNASAIAGMAGRYASRLNGPIAMSAPRNRIRCRGTPKRVRLSEAGPVIGELELHWQTAGGDCTVSEYRTPFQGETMKRSTERILTTHAGSLPRPEYLIQAYLAGNGVLSPEAAPRLSAAVSEVVEE